MADRGEIHFSSLALIGLGQIGCSLALALKSQGKLRITGYDLSTQVSCQALRLGAVDQLAASAGQALEGAEVAVLATPVSSIVEIIREEARGLGQCRLVTDVGSVKGPVVRAMDSFLGPDGPGVGGHPMTGNEIPGPGGASKDMFAGATWVICPGEESRPDALGLARALAARAGALPMTMSPGDHDAQVARSSHLPYIVAASLARAAGGRGALSLVGPSLRDGTRVAGSSPAMAGDYCYLNRQNLLEEVRIMEQELGLVRDMLQRGDREGLDSFLGRARELREGFIGAGARREGES